MTTYDLYLLSPELSLAGLAVLILLLDRVISRKGFLIVLGVLGLTIPLGFSVALWAELGDTGVVSNSGILSDTVVVDSFSLFFKFLFLGVVAAVFLISIEYAKKFHRFQAEYYALILFSTIGMMLLASAGRFSFASS